MNKKIRSPERSVLEATLLVHIKALKLPEPIREYPFSDTRKWRLDFAWPHHGIAVECDGGLRVRKTKNGKKYVGRHITKQGFENDCRKINEAQLMGWTVLRYSYDMIKSGEAAEQLKVVLREQENSS